jgi:hypothetical protein
MTEKKTLIKKLAAVMQAVKGVPKNGFNAHFNYAFVQESDVLDVVQSELSSRDVMLIPSIEQSTRETLGTSKSGARKDLTTIDMTFTFVDGDSGEERSHHWVGWGVDGEDKGGYKAITGATKYFLLKTFLLSTGDDPERTTGAAPNLPQAASTRTPPTHAVNTQGVKLPPPPAGSVTIKLVAPRKTAKGKDMWIVTDHADNAYFIFHKMKDTSNDWVDGDKVAAIAVTAGQSGTPVVLETLPPNDRGKVTLVGITMMGQEDTPKGRKADIDEAMPDTPPLPTEDEMRF